MKRRILWLVAARSGSKSIPDKNIKLLGGIPLIAYRIKSAISIASPKDVWVSTDSQEYAGIARSFGATVPFLRPPELATDSAKSVDVVLHAMSYANSLEENYDAVGLLEPTSPFVSSVDLINAVEKLFDTAEAESVVAVRRVRPSTFYIQEEDKYLAKIAVNIREQGILRRQEEKREITPSGGFYIAKWNSFKSSKTFYSEKTLSYLVPDVNGLEIDEPVDWLWAEFLIEKNIIDIDYLLGKDIGCENFNRSV